MKNKKSMLLFIVFAILIICLATIIVIFNKSNDNDYKEISYSEYKELVNDKKTFILYVHQTGCSHCNTFSPILKKVVRNNEINNCYGLNLSDMTKDELIEFSSSVSVSGTPTTIFFFDGIEDEYDHVVGVKSEKVLTNKFRNKGFIK